MATLGCLMGFASAELCGRPAGGLYISLLRGESCSPPDSYVKPPAPQNATLSGHRSLQTELVKTMSYWGRVHPESSLTGILVQVESRDTDTTTGGRPGTEAPSPSQKEPALLTP